ncbi:MAG: hypothetical protein ACOC10_05090 [Bacteroidota bacterium]
MDFKYIFNLNDWLISLGLGEQTAMIINTGFSIIIILLLAYLSDILAKQILVRTVKKLVKHTRTNWDDILCLQQNSKLG